MTFWIGLAVFIVVDAVVIYFVLKRVMMERLGTSGAGLADLTGIVRFANLASEESKNYLRANFGGDTASLPRALQGLVDRLGQRASEQGLNLDRAMLKQFAVTAAIAHKAAKPEDVRAAIESVA